MKLSNLILLPFGCFLVLTSCKKNASNQTLAASVTATVPTLNMALSAKAVAVLDTIIHKGQIKSKTQFKTIVDSLNATFPIQTVKNNTTGGLRILDDDDSGTDTENIAVMDDARTGTDDSGTAANTGSGTISSYFQSDLSFATRGNQVRLLVPFLYDLGTLSGTGTYTINNIRSSTQAQILPLGDYWGEVTQIPVWYVNGGTTSDPWQQSLGITAYDVMQEKRTILTSTQGTTTISVDANVDDFTIGSQYSEGFTVSSANNIYNQYDATAAGTIYIGQTAGITGVPATQFLGTIVAHQTGILRNQ